MGDAGTLARRVKGKGENSGGDKWASKKLQGPKYWHRTKLNC